MKNRNSIISLLLFSLMVSLSFIPGASTLAGSEDIDALTRGYQEPGKSQLRKAIAFASRKHEGRILSARPNLESEEKRFKIRMLLDSGHIKTFYINKNATKISE